MPLKSIGFLLETSYTSFGNEVHFPVRSAFFYYKSNSHDEEIGTPRVRILNPGPFPASF